jgi:ubiquinone/menaquinone biosynthesis C-methylase UbiE
VSSFIFMKVLESAPARYDRGIRILSRGRIDAVYEELAARVATPGRTILDIGCGTGGVALACAGRGARVTGIDPNPAMLEVARSKPVPGEAGGTVEWLELGAAEIEDRLPERSFDAVVSCLAFSEMGEPEQEYALRVSLTRLKPGGRLVLADEVLPEPGWRRLRYRLGRLPHLLLTYLLTQATTRPVVGLEDRVRAAGYQDVVARSLWSGAFQILEARREEVARK